VFNETVSATIAINIPPVLDTDIPTIDVKSIFATYDVK